MLGNKLLNIQFAKYHIWNNKSKGFPNMVLSIETFNQSVRTEYSEAVNARYTFQPLIVRQFSSGSGSLFFEVFIFEVFVFEALGRRSSFSKNLRSLRLSGTLGDVFIQMCFISLAKSKLFHRKMNFRRFRRLPATTNVTSPYKTLIKFREKLRQITQKRCTLRPEN